MPSPLPNIVKSYKSVFVHAGVKGGVRSGVQVKKGDIITILAKGTIDPGSMSRTAGTSGNIRGPKELLWYELSEQDSTRRYNGPELIEVEENGNIYVGYGEGFAYRKPETHIGFFSVGIIIWNTKDVTLMVKFLEDASLAQPQDKELMEMAQEFKKRQEITASLQEKSKEVKEIEKELSMVEARETPIITLPPKQVSPEVKKVDKEEKITKKGEKPTVPPSIKKGEEKPKVIEPEKLAVVPKSPEEKKIAIPVKEREPLKAKVDEKEKRIEELTEKLQKALDSIKELEEMKKVLARLESMEVERARQPKNLPVIAIGYPQDGMKTDSEIISLYGVAEHEKGISKFEILINDRHLSLKDQRDLRLIPKERKRIEFSERIRLSEGQNRIAILVQGEDGLKNQKNLSVQLVRKREEVYAVVIGINKYKNLPSLKYAANDAREFHQFLIEVNQIPKDHVWLLLDEEATLEKFKTTLGTILRRSAGKDDTVIIFLAGHGATEQDTSSPDGDGLEKYILPYNADPKDLYASAMPMSEIARIFQRISSERLVFIGDTCYSGGSGGRTIPVAGKRANISGVFWERVSQGKGRVILTASDANEVSVEKDELKHGVFTYYLLEGLRGKADLDKDKLITVDEIYQYVSTKVPQATGQNQHPVKKGEMTGQIVLGVVK
jgi:hypothetical protein